LFWFFYLLAFHIWLVHGRVTGQLSILGEESWLSQYIGFFFLWVSFTWFTLSVYLIVSWFSILIALRRHTIAIGTMAVMLGVGDEDIAEIVHRVRGEQSSRRR
jgi:hypothetical protein